MWYRRRNVEAKDEFVISVAKGQTIKLTSQWTRSLEASIGGSHQGLTANIKTVVTCSHTTQEEFKGPEGDNNFNCREFKCKFFRDEGNYTQHVVGWSSGETRDYSGTFTEPTYYWNYSIDRTI